MRADAVTPREAGAAPGQAAHAAALGHYGYDAAYTLGLWKQLDADSRKYFAGIEQASAAAAEAELAALRELLGEVGVLAANAPEDAAFSVCEEIAMRIAAHGVPDDGRHPDGCACQFCREDEREERDREELDDDTDNTIPDTEGSDW